MYRIIPASVRRGQKRKPQRAGRTRQSSLIRPPGKPRCTDLLARTRFSFTSVSVLWKKIPEPFRKTWQRQITDSDMTAWGVYLSENATRMREGDPAILCPGSGLDLPKQLRASSPAKGVVSIWHEDSRPVLLTVVAQKIENGIGGSEITAFHDLACEQLAHIEGFSSGEYFVYCVGADAPVISMSRCSASAAFRVSVQ